jgi:hypothetical protein
MLGGTVDANPVGHPCCIGWGHPDEEAVRRFVRDRR